MWLLGALLLALQVCNICCLIPDSVNPPRSAVNIEDLCKEGKCNQNGTNGEFCLCDVFARDLEPDAVAGGTNKVRVTITKKMCWDEDAEVWHFQEDCSNNVDRDSQFEDKIEICYEDNIDSAQAMCRHFNKGDSFRSMAHSSRRVLKSVVKSSRRTHIAKLVCPQHAEGLKDCSFSFLPPNTTCKQMVAHCWFTNCWIAGSTIRATLKNSARIGAERGRVIYGQACKLNLQYDLHCGRQCFRCPDSFKGDPRDGTTCFAANGGNTQGTLIWEPHFRTLDGKHFDFQGQCSYYLIKNAHFSIMASFKVCGKKGVTCVHEIIISSGHSELRLGQGNDFTIKYRGRTNIHATKPFHNDDINYYLASSEFDAVDVWNGFKILWDRKAEYKTIIPGWNINMMTRGLLGNRNGNPDDDMIKPNGELTTDPIEFGNSWMVPGSCPAGVSPHAPQNLVLTQPEREAANAAGCKYMNRHNSPTSGPDPFKNCTSKNALDERKAEYENCLLDMDTCYSTRDPSECLCPSFEFMADYCESMEEGVGDWREKMPNSLCHLSCDSTKGEVFRMDADPCSQTCDAIKYIKENVFECIKMKVEGCNCREGYARDANGNCIPIAQCP